VANLDRRLKKLEAWRTDSSGLVPYSSSWFEYWGEQFCFGLTGREVIPGQALYLTGLNFSISAAIGFVSLSGVSVMDGILMMTFYNQERSHGLSPVDAMYRAATTRMRPLLMTSLSACIGLLPAAISTGIGSQVQRPLATVIVGGMLVGPVLLLLAVPALRLIFIGSDKHHQYVSEEPK
jgi:heavy metal efflux system protein